MLTELLAFLDELLSYLESVRDVRSEDGRPARRSPEVERLAQKTRALRASYETQDSLAVGVLYSVDLPTYDEQLAVKVPALKDHPLVDLPLYQRDVDPLFRELA